MEANTTPQTKQLKYPIEEEPVSQAAHSGLSTKQNHN